MALRTVFRELFQVSQDNLGDNYDGTVAPDAGAVGALDEVWASGTGPSQADLFWAEAEIAPTAGVPVDLDLRALANGPRGSTVLFADVRAVLIRLSEDSTATDATFGVVAPATPWIGAWGAAFEMILGAGDRFRWFSRRDGAGATAVGSKLIRFEHSAGTAKWKILIVGTSA